MNTYFIKLTEPTLPLVDVLNRWENDPALIPMTRPNQNKSELERQSAITLDSLTERLEHLHIYLIYLDDQLIGEMNYMVDPNHLYKKEQGTAWIGITIGEPEGRGKGIGYTAIQYLEEQIKKQGLKRIELGVFEFNTQAQKLYQKLGYKEIGMIEDFTFWQDKMWSDIRMEKYIGDD
ncbi:GNAT family N-acetyltransferase [Rossellomorea sp. NS-SX7]|uniref:GNAT family N-acetyltransferase n=1 Tax=Rossellomorea sp. NS-SX7 TaxID=3463856 RepID=UPI004057FE16